MRPAFPSPRGRVRRARDRVIWCDRGWMPTYYGFCPNANAWRREFKRLNVPPEPYPTADAMCTHLTRDGKNTCVIVTVNERIDRKARTDRIGAIALITHEAVHVWQAICRDIREENPSSEFEAYAIQAITSGLIDAYEKTRLRRARTPRSKRQRRR